jgi:predicted nucleic acid-binding protein
MTARVFVDTNILVYAHDIDAGAKHLLAEQKVRELWCSRVRPVVSIQVLQEFFVNLCRKGATISEATEQVQNYMAWHVVENSASLLLSGIEMTERWRLSLWDALIIAAAKKAGAGVVWSEDFNTGQEYGGVVAVNPLV